MDKLTKAQQKRFDELMFATNPTDTKGVLWKWNKHGREVLYDFVANELANQKETHTIALESEKARIRENTRKTTLEEVEGIGKRYKNKRYSTDNLVILGRRWDKLKERGATSK